MYFSGTAEVTGAPATGPVTLVYDLGGSGGAFRLKGAFLTLGEPNPSPEPLRANAEPVSSIVSFDIFPDLRLNFFIEDDMSWPVV